MPRIPTTAIAATLSLLAATVALAQAEPFTMSATTIVSAGLTRPVGMAAPRNDPTRLFVIEQYVGTNGQVRVVDLASGTVRATPFLTVPTVATGGEQGLLGICFHPSYATNGWFYVNYVRGTQTRIERYTVSADPNVADPASAKLILAIDRLANHHNCGWIEFGPDGKFYVGVGDGAQTMAPLSSPEAAYGRMLRIDVDAGDPYAIPADNPWVNGPGIDSGWANGLRNPWRCAFDAVTGELWIADVGNALWEEVNVQPANAAGINYGWPCWEGDAAYLTLGICPPAATLAFPLHTVAHSAGGVFNCSITGGRVYRGPDSASARGLYFFADLCSNKIWTIQRSVGAPATVTDRTAALQLSTGITSFGEDALGRLYYCTLAGRVVRINAADTGCVADLDGDGEVAAGDLTAVLSNWGRLGATREDLDRSGVIDGGDLTGVFATWGACP